MSDQYYNYFKNDEGLSRLSDVALERKHNKLRHETGKDYRLIETSESSKGVFRRRHRRWFQLYIPVAGGVMGQDAWVAFSDTLFDSEDMINVIDGILLGISLGRAHHREDMDVLRLENNELATQIQELSEEYGQHRDLVARAEAKSIDAPFHITTLGVGDTHFVSHLYNPEEGQYLSILNELREKMLMLGATENRTTVTATKVFGRTMRFDLSNGNLPLLTTKKLRLKPIVTELIWFLKGITNNEWLRQQGVSIWNEWATTEDGKDRKKQPLPLGSLGPLYGEQWRRFPAGEFFYNLTDEELRTYVKAMANDQFDKMAHDLAPLDVSLGRFHTDGNPHRISPESIGFDTPPFVEIRQYLTKVGIDQISQTLFLLKHRPNSRRIIVTAWNPQVVPSDELSPQENVKRRRAALAACHAMFQIVTEPLSLAERVSMVRAYYTEMGALTKLAITADNVHSFLKMDGDPFPTHRLNLWMGQRSADHVIGVPFNIASYALLAHMLAAQANMVPGEFLWVGGDVHLYSNLQGAAEVQLTREPRPFPKVLLKKVSTIFDYTLDDIELVDYKPMPAIKTEIAV